MKILICNNLAGYLSKFGSVQISEKKITKEEKLRASTNLICVKGY